MVSEVVIDKVAIYVVKEVRHRGWGRYRQRGRYIQGRYIQWALYIVVSVFLLRNFKTARLLKYSIHLFILFLEQWEIALQLL